MKSSPLCIARRVCRFVILFSAVFLFSWVPATAADTAGATSSWEVADLPAMRFAYIAPGSFLMGSPKKEKGRDDDEVQHSVTLTRGFYMQTTEVTVGQWRAFVAATGYKSEAELQGSAFVRIKDQVTESEGYYWDKPGYPQSDRHPVSCLSWNDARAFAEWLSAKDGRTYRLPTEAEWEYARRAGSTTAFTWGKKPNCKLANYGNGITRECKKNPGVPMPVGSFPANAWGLFDMTGNVWEWCQDYYGEYEAKAVTDPTGPEESPTRVVRGGSCWSFARHNRSACRAWNDPIQRYYNLGFRLVANP